MIPIDKAVVARVNKGKLQFEILVDPESAQKAQASLKKGKDVDLNDVLAVDDIFEDTKKGKRASKKILQSIFETDDVTEVAKLILKDGVVHTTSAQRDKKQKEIWDRIISLISMNAIDAKTRKPVPDHVVEDALHASYFRIDKTKTVQDQLPDAIKHVKKIIPITFNEKTVSFGGIPSNVAKKCLEYCRTLGSVEKEAWNGNTSVTVVVKVPAGLREELMDKVNDVTRGKIDVKLID